MESMYSTRSVRFGEKPSILRQLFFPSAMTVGNPLRMIENGKVVFDGASGARKWDPPSPPPFLQGFPIQKTGICNQLLKTIAFIGSKKNPAIQKKIIRFSIKNLIANINLYALNCPKLNFGCYFTFEIIFKTLF